MHCFGAASAKYVRHAILELVAQRTSEPPAQRRADLRSLAGEPAGKSDLGDEPRDRSEAIVMAASRSALTGDRYYDQPNKDQLDLDALVGRIGWDSGHGVSGRGRRSTSPNQGTRTGRDTGVELVRRRTGVHSGTERSVLTGILVWSWWAARAEYTWGPEGIVLARILVWSWCAARTEYTWGAGRPGIVVWSSGAARTGVHLGIDPTRTGQDTGLEPVRRQDRSTPGDRGNSYSPGILVWSWWRRQDRSTPGDRRDLIPLQRWCAPGVPTATAIAAPPSKWAG